MSDKALPTATNAPLSQKSKNLLESTVPNLTYAPSSKEIPISSTRANQTTHKQIPDIQYKRKSKKFAGPSSWLRGLFGSDGELYETEIPPQRVLLKLRDSHTPIRGMVIEDTDCTGDLQITVAAKRQVVKAEGVDDRINIELLLSVGGFQKARRCVKATLAVELPGNDSPNTDFMTMIS
jgi:hypothetical protein